VDDHSLFCESFALLLQKLLHFGEVLSVNNGEDALKELEKNHIDFVFMDIHMPGLNGIETTQLIRERFPEMKVVAVSMLDDRNHIMKMLRSGAAGYILKNTGAEELREGLQRIMNGEVYVSKQVGDIVYGKGKAEKSGFMQLVKLSNREEEVMKLICEGLSNEKIAATLNISVRTVETHRAKIYSKLNVSNVTELMMRLREG
jgi:DNA-binding NarL/FixJ family response regulator